MVTILIGFALNYLNFESKLITEDALARKNSNFFVWCFIAEIALAGFN